MRRWRQAMQEALYGEETGFYRRAGSRPADHFRTSGHSGPRFASALLALLERVDASLDHPDSLDVVDIGAGRGELLRFLVALAKPELRERLRPAGVEVVPRPADLPEGIAWRSTRPDSVTGLLLATEWLDNVPLDIAIRDGDDYRYLLVDATGGEAPGGRVSEVDATWIRHWWPAGERIEIGLPRDLAWADAVGRVTRGLALAVDYGHTRADRPQYGTLSGFRNGRWIQPVPDGSCDLTAHIAADAVAAAGSAVAGVEASLVRQAEALRLLGLSGARPPMEMAQKDPAGYARALADASHAAELTDPAGLGGHLWLFQPVGTTVPALKMTP